jgi:hypothetical protein
MARQHGAVWLEGKVGGLIFYKTKYGKMVRSEWTVSKERLATDPKLEARRGANKEFGYSSRVGKLLREALQSCCKFAEEGSTNHRLTSAIVKAVKEDKTGERGKRRLTADNVGRLVGFPWMEHNALSDVLLKDCVVQLDAASGAATLTVSGLVPADDITLQDEATHLQLTLVISRIDYENDDKKYAFEQSAVIKASSKAAVNISLSAVLPSGTGDLIVAGVGYQVMQEVGGKMNGLVERSGFEVVEAGIG